MRNIKYILLLVVIPLLFSCKGDENYEHLQELVYENAHRYPISRIEIYPNGPQLVADGKSQIHFLVKCYQNLNDTTEVPVIKDRIPYDKLFVKADDGKVFNVNEGYSTSDKTLKEVNFSCELGNVKSKSVKVQVITPEKLQWDSIKVPVYVHALFSEQSKETADYLTKEVMQKIFDRANKVFAGELYHAPSSCPSNIVFELQKFEKVALDPETDKDPNKEYEYIQQHFIYDPQNILHIWVITNANGIMSDKLNPLKMAPSYTFGNPNDIGFISSSIWEPAKQLVKVSDISEVPPLPENVGFAIIYSDCYGMLTGDSSNPIEKSLGTFYGLLPTGNRNKDFFIDNSNMNDVDFCPDTFSYFDNGQKVKETLVGKKEDIPTYYVSYNIMDADSKCNSISRDQIIRMRQVMKYCPYRQMNSLKPIRKADDYDY